MSEGNSRQPYRWAPDRVKRAPGQLQARGRSDYARRHGVRGFTADVLGDNVRMLSVFRRSGHRMESRLIDGTFEVRILFGEPPVSESRADAGEQPARPRAPAKPARDRGEAARPELI